MRLERISVKHSDHARQVEGALPVLAIIPSRSAESQILLGSGGTGWEQVPAFTDLPVSWGVMDQETSYLKTILMAQ